MKSILKLALAAVLFGVFLTPAGVTGQSQHPGQKSSRKSRATRSSHHRRVVHKARSSHSAASASLAAYAAGVYSPAVPHRLRFLASRAQARGGWAELRRYASGIRDAETQSLAYFALGYREYLARENGLAAGDLKAAESGSLADIASYYQALASREINRPEDAITALRDFPKRYPQSVYRRRAADLLASLLIKAGRPGEALAELQAEPLTKRRPSSLLLTAQAQAAQRQDLAAAKTYQLIEAAFPTLAEAKQAKAALDRLRRGLGSNYPEMSAEAQTDLADNLFQAGQFREALAAYDNSLLTLPKSPRAGEWRVGRARCFIALREYALAQTALRAREKDPEADAERLSLLVRIAELSGDEPSVVQALNSLYQKHPHSSYYGESLAYAGGYFARQGFWQNAGNYYKLLATNFPDSIYAAEAAWRVAWYSLLAGDWSGAKAELAAFQQRYPGSAMAPAALYWLAWVERKDSHQELADEIDRLTARRYANTYYGLRARERRPSSHVGDTSAAVINASGLANIGVALPARAPSPLPPCGSSSVDPALQPYRAVTALSLPLLGEEYLENLLAIDPQNHQAALTLARSRAARKDIAAALFAAKRAVPDYGAYPFDALPEELWHFLYPQAHWSLVRRFARANGIDPYLVMGLIRQESAFASRATSYTGARGLMQMEPYTAVDRVRGRLRRRRIVNSLYNPAFNIRAGCRYLASLLKEFNHNLPEALAAYNAGDIRVRQWIANGKINDPDKFLETIPFTDTRAYVEMVLRDRMIYRGLLTGEASFKSCPALKKNFAPVG